jgi:hypothetical protein
MEYELSRLDTAIEKCDALVKKYSNHKHAYDYYTTQLEVLMAMSYVVGLLQGVKAP